MPKLNHSINIIHYLASIFNEVNLLNWMICMTMVKYHISHENLNCSASEWLVFMVWTPKLHFSCCTLSRIWKNRWIKNCVDHHRFCLFMNGFKSAHCLFWNRSSVGYSTAISLRIGIGMLKQAFECRLNCEKQIVVTEKKHFSHQLPLNSFKHFSDIHRCIVQCRHLLTALVILSELSPVLVYYCWICFRVSHYPCLLFV